MKKLALTFTLLFGALFFVLLFSPVATADENSKDPEIFGKITTDIASEGDAYGRVYPVNYHIDADGAGTRLAATEHEVTDIGTSAAGAVEGGYGVQGRIACYQINATSGTSNAVARTVPVVCSGYNSMTVQIFSYSDSSGLASVGVYSTTGSASCRIDVVGSLLPSADVLAATRVGGNLPFVLKDAPGVLFAESMLPDARWLNRQAAISSIICTTDPALLDSNSDPNQAVISSASMLIPIYEAAGVIEPATSLIRNGIYQIPLNGINAVGFTITANSATQCIVARFNRNFVIDAAASRSYDYPAP